MLIYLLTAIVAVALKAHYSGATANDLRWILAPTAALVGWLRDETLLFEASLGWVPADHRYVIAPVCAGVNFMILLFGASVLGFPSRWRCFRRRCLWLVAMLGTAYVVTIGVNALRIVVAVWLYEAEIHTGWLTAERVHRVAGTVIYLLALSAAWISLDRASHWRARLLPSRDGARITVRGGSPGGSPPNAYLPLLGYVGMTVVLPLANGAWHRFGDHYIEHALTVSLLALAAGLLLSTLRSVTSSSTGSATKGGAHGQSDDTGG